MGTLGKTHPKVIETHIARRVDETPELFKLWLTTASPFVFKAGQYCTIGVDGIERPYSIVSAPSESELELLVELIPEPDGNLTPLLHRMKVGDKLTLRPRPKGIFTFESEFSEHVLVATVAGVAPYISILRELIQKDTVANYGMHILQGASYHNEFGYADELFRMAANCQRISYLPVVSRPSETRNMVWKGAEGRVHTLLNNYLQGHNLKPSSTLVYACGHPGMIAAVRTLCLEGGWKLKEERFWK